MILLFYFLLIFVSSAADPNIKRLVVVQHTDIHGYVEGNSDSIANFALSDLDAFSRRTKLKAAEAKTGFIMIDSGDQIQGAGFSDAINSLYPIVGVNVWDVMSRMEYTALTVGNHDLRDPRATEWLATHAESVFGQRYIASNVYYTDQNGRRPLTNTQYRAFVEPTSGLRIIFLGLMYDFDLAPEFISIKNPIDWLRSPEAEEIFIQASVDLGGQVDMIVALCHIGAMEPQSLMVTKAIREATSNIEGYYEDTPLLFAGGHMHQWYYNICGSDYACIRLEADHYLRSVTAYDMTFVQTSDGHWVWQHIPDPRLAKRLAKSGVLTGITDFSLYLGILPTELQTPESKLLRAIIRRKHVELGLDTVVACPTSDFTANGPVANNTSLANFFLYTVGAYGIPKSDYYDPSTGKGSTLLVINTLDLRNDIKHGPLTLDSLLKVFPFHEEWLVMRNLTPLEIYNAIYATKNSTKIKKPISLPTGNPHYVLSVPITDLASETRTFDLVGQQYDMRRFQMQIVRKHPGESDKYQLYTYRGDNNITELGAAYDRVMREKFTCPSMT